MKPPYTVGIIGAGDVTANAHLPVLLAMKRVSVDWIADVDPQRAKALGKAYRVPPVSLSSGIAALPDADVVVLALPYGVRKPYYEFLRNRECGVYVEKPFARSIGYHQEICSWFPDYRLACGLQARSWGPTRTLTQLIQSKLFGDLREIHYSFGGPGVVTGGKYSAELAIAGGGILFDNGVHGIDALLFMTEATAVRVEEVSMILDDGLDLHTDARLQLTLPGYERGVDCRLTVSFLQESRNRLEFVFDHAEMWVTLFSDGRITVKPSNGGTEYTLTPTQKPNPLTHFQTVHAHWSRFLSGLIAKEANWTSASRSVLTTEVLETLYRKGGASTPC